MRMEGINRFSASDEANGVDCTLKVTVLARKMTKVEYFGAEQSLRLPSAQKDRHRFVFSENKIKEQRGNS